MSYLPLILLVIAMAIGIPIAYRVWSETHEEDDPVTDADVLSGIEEAYAAGEIDEDEFHRARALIVGDKGAEDGLPRPVPKPPPPTPPPADDGMSGSPTPADST